LPCVFILAHGKVFSPPKSQIQLLLKIFFATWNFFYYIHTTSHTSL
jgi:hypothetical protein